jgi:hypothetical protein
MRSRSRFDGTLGLGFVVGSNLNLWKNIREACSDMTSGIGVREGIEAWE